MRPLFDGQHRIALNKISVKKSSQCKAANSFFGKRIITIDHFSENTNIYFLLIFTFVLCQSPGLYILFIVGLWLTLNIVIPGIRNLQI